MSSSKSGTFAGNANQSVNQTDKTPEKENAQAPDANSADKEVDLDKLPKYLGEGGGSNW